MRYFPALVVLGLAAGAVACGSGISLPAVEPEQVEIFMPGSFPSDSYKVIARITESRGLGTADDEMIDLARARAAKLGADALIVSAIRQTTEGQIEVNLQQEQLKILEGLAVYFPSRHPELEGQ